MKEPGIRVLLSYKFIVYFLSHPDKNMKNFYNDRDYILLNLDEGHRRRWNAYPKERTGKLHSNLGFS